MTHLQQPRSLAIVSLLAVAVLAACHGHPHAADDPHGHATAAEPSERPGLSFTDWTADTELFIELPALVVGKDSACAAHVTRLKPYAALASGSVAVLLQGPQGSERFESNKPSIPGIFRPVAAPKTAGKRRLVVQIRSDGLSADHDLGEVRVYPDDTAAHRAHPPEPEAPGRIAFLKEQQWPIEFDVALVAEQLLRRSLQLAGTLAPEPLGEFQLTAPVAGRIAAGPQGFPQLGATAQAGQLLALLAPRLEATDLASLDLAVESAEIELRHAARERERLTPLVQDGAVAERRLLEAKVAEGQAKAALTAAQRRLRQFRQGDSAAEGSVWALRLSSPLTGVVTALLTSPGSAVQAGAPLLRVTDLSRLRLELRVPEVDLGKLGALGNLDNLGGASVEVEGLPEPIELPASATWTRSHAIDPLTRTLTLAHTLDNSARKLAIGAWCRVKLGLGEARRVTAVPESAIVDDNGTPVVYVMAEGESFERRIVRLGLRDRGFVEVLGGVKAGERVVSRGAWSVKLAASSGSVPAHGHAH